MTDLFFDPSDQTRMQACSTGVLREGMCVAMHCPQLALMEYYGQIFLRQLREELPTGSIESYNPTDADILIEKFNQMVSDMSVQEALKPGNLSDVRKVWVLKNAHNMAPHEIELLGQMLQQFPGAKVRVILWMVGKTPSDGLFSALGKKMMRWNIALPNAAQTQTFWNKARATGQEEDLRPMLDQLRLMEHVPAALRAVRNAKLDTATQSKKKSKRVTSKVAVGFLVVLALLMGSTVFVAWLHPEAFAWLQWNTAPPEPAPTAQISPPQPIAPDVQASKLPEETSSQALKVDEAAVELPDEALDGKKWAAQLPAQRWLVLHGAYKSISIAKQVKNAYPGLKNSRLVPVYKPNEPLASFVLASGPFETLQSAEEFTKLSTLPNPGTVRTERNLKSRLNPVTEPRTTP